MVRPSFVPFPARRRARSGSEDGGAAGRRGMGPLGWLLLGVGVLYGILLVVHLHEILAVTYANSDVAIVPVVAHRIDVGAPLGSVVIGNRPLYEEILGATVVGWLPDHRELWRLIPVAWLALDLALLGWAAAVGFGRRSALLLVVAVACLGQMGRQYFFSWDFHDLPQLHAILLMAALVYAARRDAPWREPRLVLGAIGLGLLSALPEASDPLFLISGLAPFLGAAVILAIARPGRASAELLGLAAAVCGLALLGAHFLTVVMAAHGFVHSPFPLTLTPMNELGHDAGLVLQGLTNIAGGDFLGIAPDGHGLLTLVRGGLILAGLVAALLTVLAHTVALLRGRGPRAAPALAYLAFWALALLLGLGAYLLSNVAVDYLSGRYLLAPYLAIPALLVTAAPDRAALRRRALSVGVGAFAAAGALALPATAGALPGLAPGPSAARRLAAYAAREHVQIGFGSYWTSVALTWETRFRLSLGAVGPCPVGTATGLCPWGIALSAWYRPRSQVRSLLIVDPTVPNTGGISPAGTSWMTSLTATDLGPPLTHARIAGMEVYVYGYDIASRFPPAPTP
ncbi:hypothetical protein [Conexibacter sp. DBS9H8]|uniref:hypothetical protein n=1 Tax=Conexibacter sp. DBS9H8 TaxID=2937801 RepID=UPI00200CA766|nr:hypothetical protein [Conexibacter sp. DBS9H8]